MLIPVNGQVLVRLPAKEKGGVFIPETLSDSTQQGEIIEVAKDIKVSADWNGENQIKPGAKVRWQKFAEADGSFDYNGDKCVLIDSKQLTGVFV